MLYASFGNFAQQPVNHFHPKKRLLKLFVMDSDRHCYTLPDVLPDRSQRSEGNLLEEIWINEKFGNPNIAISGWLICNSESTKHT